MMGFVSSLKGRAVARPFSFGSVDQLLIAHVFNVGVSAEA